MLCLAVFALSALFRFTIWRAVPTPLDYAGSLPARAGELALGAWLALCFRDPVLWRRVQKLAPAALAAGGIGFVSAAAVERSFNVYTPGMFLFGLPCISLALVAILTLSLGQGAVAAAVSVGWLRWLGGISYGVYVYHVLLTPVFHWVVVTIAPHADRNQTLGLTFAVAGFLTLAVAQISFVLFERPLLRLKNRVRPEHLEAANRPATLHG
jgi:peptidoglycan/LPS O-acetylase OafA/YrhL